MAHDKKSSVDKHCINAKHQKALSSTVQQRQQPIDSTNAGWGDYVGKVTSAFLSADIPLYKLRNPEMQSLFQFLGRKAPSESSRRKRVDDMGKCEVDQVCEILLGKIIFMVVDESEISGCKYLNTLVGDNEVPETTYCIARFFVRLRISKLVCMLLMMQYEPSKQTEIILFSCLQMLPGI